MHSYRGDVFFYSASSKGAASVRAGCRLHRGWILVRCHDSIQELTSHNVAACVRVPTFIFLLKSDPFPSLFIFLSTSAVHLHQNSHRHILDIRAACTQTLHTTNFCSQHLDSGRWRRILNSPASLEMVGWDGNMSEGLKVVVDRHGTACFQKEKKKKSQVQNSECVCGVAEKSADFQRRWKINVD